MVSACVVLYMDLQTFPKRHVQSFCSAPQLLLEPADSTIGAMNAS